jgi:hypothetical protein
MNLGESRAVGAPVDPRPAASRCVPSPRAASATRPSRSTGPTPVSAFEGNKAVTKTILPVIQSWQGGTALTSSTSAEKVVSRLGAQGGSAAAYLGFTLLTAAWALPDRSAMALSVNQF